MKIPGNVSFSKKIGENIHKMGKALFLYFILIKMKIIRVIPPIKNES
jgi:hypothetical protein